jgi:hypothetical protein
MNKEKYTGCFNVETEDFISVFDTDLETDLKEEVRKQIQAAHAKEIYIEMKAQYLYNNPELTEEDFKNELRAQGIKI